MAVDWGEDEPPPLRGPLTRRTLRYFRPYRAPILLVLGCLAVSAVLALVPALVTKGLIDHLTGPDPGLRRVGMLVGAGLAAALAGGLVGVAESYLRTLIGQGIMLDLRNELFERLLGQSVGFFTDRRSGDLLSRLSSDVEGIRDVVGDTVFGMAQSVIVAVATLALMLRLNWRLTLLALALSPVVVLPSRRAGTRIYRARKAIQEKLSELTVHLQEVLGISGILLVKAFGTQARERGRLRELNVELRELEIRRDLIGRWFALSMDVLKAAVPAAFWLFGGYLVLTGQATVGTIVTFVTVLLFRLYYHLGDLASLHVNLTGSLALFQRLFAFIDLPPAVAESPGAVALRRPRGAVEFKHVTFRYRPGLRPALENITFTASPGQLVALVGPSGAGKTTLTSLLCRFYDCESGAVRIDGQDVRDLELASLGDHLGLVFQDSFLFHASIAENLRYARPEATVEELERAAEAAFIHEFIASLPEGYDTLVGERGHRLSGGEKQRMAIARVILKDPRILVLDEATSHLDSVSEQLIQAALERLFVGRTSFVIAHRLSTILAADLILVLAGGRIVERGAHRDLVAAGGLYATIYEQQFIAAEQRAGV